MAKLSSRDAEPPAADATDELPILSEAVALGDTDGPPDGTAPSPRLERRRELEQRVASLEARVARIAHGWENVESELRRNAAAVELFTGEIATLREQLDPWGNGSNAGGEERSEHEAELEALHARLQERDDELERQRAKLAEREAELEAAREAGTAPAAASDDSRAEVAALADYIANRHDHWEALEARVHEQEQRIRELEAELEQRVAREHEAEELAARESARAAEFRAELARRAARANGEAERAAETQRQTGTDVAEGAVLSGLEQQLVELRSTLDEQRERLNDSEGWAPASGADPVQDRLAAAEAELEQARGDLRRLQKVLLDRERTADEQSARLAALQNQLSEQVERLRELRGVAEPSGARGIADDLSEAEAEALRAAADANAAAPAADAPQSIPGEPEAAGAVEPGPDLEAATETAPEPEPEAEAAPGASPRTGEPEPEPGARTLELGTRGPKHEPESTPGAPALGALVCLTSEHPEHYAVTKRDMLIGRSPEADIRIATHFVSREHARVRNDGRAVYIEDLGSTNGVFVNSVRVERQELHDGDWITIGETQFRYIAAASPTPITRSG